VRTVSLDASNLYSLTYTFSVTERSRIVVEALSEIWDVDYDLRNADDQQLADSYLGSRYHDLLELVPGDYVLRLYTSSSPGNRDASYDFSFRLLNTAGTDYPLLDPEEEVAGTLAPGEQQTQIYYLQARAGELLTVEVSSARRFDRYGYSDVSIALFDPLGRRLAKHWLGDGGALQETVEESGVYTLVLFGGDYLAGTVNYTIVARRDAGDEQMPLASVPLVLGLEHSDTLDDSSATSKAFRFTLDQNALALIKGHTGGSDGAWEAHWVLRDAAGLLTGDHGYWNSYEASTDVLTLAAGDYTLEVSLDYGPGGSIAVRVDSGTNAIQVVAGHGIGELISFGDSDAGIYRVDFAAGDEYLLQAANGSEWSIHGADFLQAHLLADGAVLRFVPSQDSSWYFVRRRDFAGDSSISIERPQPPITLEQPYRRPTASK
jgi:hypothetical protein